MATGTNTPEYEIFHRNFHSICRGVSQDLLEFAAKVFERNMIGLVKLQEISNSPNTTGAAIGLIVILLQRIEQDNSTFYEILEILQSMPTLAPVVNMLQLQSGNSPPTVVPPTVTQTCSLSTLPPSTQTLNTASQTPNMEHVSVTSQTWSPQPPPSAAESSLNESAALDPKVHMDLQYQLTTYRDTITTQFASYVSEVYERIEAKQIDLNKIKQFLENKLDSDLEGANSLDDIFRLLRRRNQTSFNFLNYHIYESLRGKFIPEEWDESFKYPDYLKDYASKHRVSEFLGISPKLKEIDINTSNNILHIKFDTQASDKLISVLELQQSLAPLLEVMPSALQILNIEQGCVIVTFLIPAHAANLAFQHVREFTPEQLSRLSVKWIKLGDSEKVSTEGKGPAPEMLEEPTKPKAISADVPSAQLSSNIDSSRAVEAFKNRLEALTSLLQHNLSSVSTSLFTKSIISEAEQQEAMEETVITKTRAVILLDVVLSRIKFEPQVFVEVVKILESEPSFRKQANELVLCYQCLTFTSIEKVEDSSKDEESSVTKRSVERMKMKDIQVSNATDALRKTCDTLSPEEAKIAVDTLSRIIHNVLVYPTEEKFRQVKTTSKRFRGEVWRHPVAQEFLTLVGWSSVDGEKIILQSIELIPGAFAALVRAKIYLEQPDLFPLGITNVPRVVSDFQVLFPRESALVKGVIKHAPLFPPELRAITGELSALAREIFIRGDHQFLSQFVNTSYVQASLSIFRSAIMIFEEQEHLLHQRRANVEEFQKIDDQLARLATKEKKLVEECEDWCAKLSQIFVEGLKTSPHDIGDATIQRYQDRYQEMCQKQVSRPDTDPANPAVVKPLDFSAYVSSLPASAQSLLDKELDWDHDGVDVHLEKIAYYMNDWETKLSSLLKLTYVDIAVLKWTHRDSNPILLQRAVLRQWKEKEGFDATYGNLLKLCCKGGDARSANNICAVLEEKVQEMEDDARELEEGTVAPSYSTTSPLPLSLPSTMSQLPKEASRPTPLLKKLHPFMLSTKLERGLLLRAIQMKSKEKGLGW